MVVLAGVNGAGKTTAARTLLAETLRLMTFVNADVIAQGLSGFDPESMAMEAGRVMLQRLHALAEQRASFAFETTLAGRSYARWLRSLRGAGYGIHLVYFWLASPDLAVARVAERVSQGGHAIPEATIRQRYHRSVANFFQLFRPLVSTWKVYDNTQASLSQLVAHGDETGQETILLDVPWHEMQQEARS
ncbi:MAG: AAA family ATPase [Gemmataceae bacterium]